MQLRNCTVNKIYNGTNNKSNFTTFGASVIFTLKKKIISILLLLVFLTPVATIYVYLQIEKATIKHKVKWKMIAGMQTEELVLLKFTKEETQTKLRWEHSKEFEFNGQMYDIVSTQVKGDSIFYHCWWDHEETNLNKKLNKLVADIFDQDEDNRKTQRSFHTYLQSFFCTTIFDWQTKPSQKFLVVNQNFLYLEIFNSYRFPPPTPPPKLS